MILTIDIGNTSVHWGVFDRDELLDSGKIILQQRIADGGWRMENTDLPKGSFDKVIVSSVVPSLDKFVSELYPEAQFVSHSNIPYITVALAEPSQVGADRLVNAVAVWKLFGGPALIIDFGTATTFDLLSAAGEYLGGAIAPGIDLSRQSLHERTAKLPLIEFAKPAKSVGEDTVQAMQAGLYFGYQGLVKELIAQYKQVLGSSTKVIATGGYAQIICADLAEVTVIDEFLSLKGLNFITSRPGRRS